MPGIQLPVLAIREANDHLLALFNENQRLESRLDELSTILKQTQDENNTLNEYVKTVNERVLMLGQEHIGNLKTLRESLKVENNRQLCNLKNEYEDLLKAEQEKLLNDFEVKLKRHEEEMLQTQKDLLKAEEKKKMELQRIIEEEKNKVSMLENKIEEERNNVSILENKIQKLNGYLVKNTNKREEKVALLNNVFKSTVENMSWCLNVVNEQEFIRSDSLVFENFHSDNGLRNEIVKMHNSDSGIEASGSDLHKDVRQCNVFNDGKQEEERKESKVDVNFYKCGNDLQNEENELEGDTIQVIQNNRDIQNYFASHNGV